ncbi:MAG TPA: EamA family transporter [bacterium]|nr:EamA family transporter [bacterium]
MAESNNRLTPADFLFFVFVPVVWGLNFIVIKDALPAFSSPQAFNALRWILAAGVLLTLVALQRDSLWIAPHHWGRLLLLALVGNVLQQLTFINGIRLTTAGHSALIMGLSPVMVAVAGAAFRLEHVERRTWAGILLSVVGLAFLVRPGAADVPPTAFLGDLLTLASAACWALYTLVSRPLTLQYPPTTVTAVSVTLAAAVLVALGVPALSTQSWEAVGWRAWGSLLYSGALTIAFGYAIWSLAIRRIGTARTAILANVNPVVALIAAWTLLGERLDAWQALGAILVLAGIALTRR